MIKSWIGQNKFHSFETQACFLVLIEYFESTEESLGTVSIYGEKMYFLTNYWLNSARKKVSQMVLYAILQYIEKQLRKFNWRIELIYKRYTIYPRSKFGSYKDHQRQFSRNPNKFTARCIHLLSIHLSLEGYRLLPWMIEVAEWFKEVAVNFEEDIAKHIHVNINKTPWF